MRNVVSRTLSEDIIERKRRMEIEVESRLRDYAKSSAAAQRDQLVAAWRAAHPNAASEASGWFHPLILLDQYAKANATAPDEVWFNDVYTVTVRRRGEDPVFFTRGGMVQLGVSSLDGSARHDWRDFQSIKNQLAGPECEGFELYPAESRLLDPSNVGFAHIAAVVADAQPLHSRETPDRVIVALAPQRAFPKPKDLGDPLQVPRRVTAAITEGEGYNVWFECGHMAWWAMFPHGELMCLQCVKGHMAALQSAKDAEA